MMKKSCFKGNTIKRMMTACAVTALLSASQMAPVVADDSEKVFSIQAQSLAAALNAYSAQADLIVTAPPELLRGKMAPAVSGMMSADQALALLLADTGLSVHRSSEAGITIVQGTDDASGSADSDQRSENMFVLEEIIVTAEKRAESLQDIPIAISAYSGDRIERAGIAGIRELKQLSSSLQFGESPAAVRVSIRGVGSELPNVGNEAGVTISQDGVPFFNPYMFDAGFLDIERVEVLRGPQGTISGRNATGGAINIHSKRPTTELEAGLKATFSNYNSLETEGYISGPLTGDDLLGRLVFRTQRADGWLHNTLRDEEHNDKDKMQVRASFLAYPSENIEASLVLEATIDRSSPAFTVAFGRARPDKPSSAEANGVPESIINLDTLEYQQDYKNTSRVENYKAILGLKWDLSPSATLTSTTGYISHNRFNRVDADGTAAFLDVYDPIEFDLWQFSQELTLAADISDNLDVIFGALYMRAKAREPVTIIRPTIPEGDLVLEPEQDLNSYAVYTQWRYRLSDQWRVTVGGRYTHDKKDYVEDLFLFGSTIITPVNEAWGAFTPRFAIDYTPSDDQTLYASVSRGFKSGTINTFGEQVVEPEYLWNYEIGVKSNWLDRRVRTALAGFYMDYTNLQQQVIRVSPVTGGPTNIIENAGTATIAGLEFEAEAYISDQFILTTGVTWYADASYNDLESIDNIFPELGTPDPASGQNIRDLEGNQLVRVPDWQFNISGQYTVPVADTMQASIRLDYQWQDRIFFSFFNHELTAQEAYGLVNLSLALEDVDGKWKIMGYVHNLTDKSVIRQK